MPTEITCATYLRPAPLSSELRALAGEWATTIDSTRQSLHGRIPPTPLHEFDTDATALKLSCAGIWVKDEGATAVGSFKVRGATAAIDALPGGTHVVTASAGNHAQGVAVACAARGLPCTIYMPAGADPVKVAAVQRLNPAAKLIIEGQSFNAAYAMAEQVAMAEGTAFIPPFEHEAIIAGQGTIAPEMLEQLQARGVGPAQLHAVFVPIGGGGLIAGIGAYLKARYGDDVKVIGVQLQGAAAMNATLSAAERPASPLSMEVDPFAGGTAVGKVGELTRTLCEAFVDQIMVVSREEAGAAAFLLARDGGSPPEVAGCLAYAGLLRYSHEHPAAVAGKHLLCVVSGRNIGAHAQSVLSSHAATGVPHLVCAAQASGREVIATQEMAQYQDILAQMRRPLVPLQRAARL